MNNRSVDMWWVASCRSIAQHENNTKFAK
jgi:hypothetical protein